MAQRGCCRVMLGAVGSITLLTSGALEHFQLNPDRVPRGEPAGAPVGCDGCSPGYKLKADPDFTENALGSASRAHVRATAGELAGRSGEKFALSENLGVQRSGWRL